MRFAATGCFLLTCLAYQIMSPPSPPRLSYRELWKCMCVGSLAHKVSILPHKNSLGISLILAAWLLLSNSSQSLLTRSWRSFLVLCLQKKRNGYRILGLLTRTKQFINCDLNKFVRTVEHSALLGLKCHLPLKCLCESLSWFIWDTYPSIALPKLQKRFEWVINQA